MASSAAAEKAILAEAEPYDCFLLDLKMPDLDGIQLCKAIRRSARYQHTPVIILTAMTDKVQIDQAFAAGATSCVTKPFDVLNLGARIKRVEAATLVRAREM